MRIMGLIVPPFILHVTARSNRTGATKQLMVGIAVRLLQVLPSQRHMLIKKPSSTSGTKGCLRHDYAVRPGLRGTTRITFADWKIPTSQRLLDRDNGLTRHQLLRFTGEVPLASNRRVRSLSGIPVGCRRWAFTWARPISQLADGMTYYSCPDFCIYVNLL